MYNIKRSLAELCNGSTTDSDSVCWGSNPYSAATKQTAIFRGLFFLLDKPKPRSKDTTARIFIINPVEPSDPICYNINDRRVRT